MLAEKKSKNGYFVYLRTSICISSHLVLYRKPTWILSLKDAKIQKPSVIALITFFHLLFSAFQTYMCAYVLFIYKYRTHLKKVKLCIWKRYWVSSSFEIVVHSSFPLFTYVHMQYFVRTSVHMCANKCSMSFTIKRCFFSITVGG